MTPKVSICIPAYKHPEYIKRALKSVFEQTFDDFEVVITDDTPDDAVLNVVKTFDSPKIKYQKNKQTKGSPENWNACLDLAEGEYIKFLHHDDWFSSQNSLEIFVKMLDDNPNADIAFSPCCNINTDNTLQSINAPTAVMLEKLKENSAILFPKNIIGAPSVTIYRNQKDLRFDKNLKWVVDIEFYSRILFNNSNFVYHKEPLISVTTGSENQVTFSCENNKNVEIYEWLYFYNKIKSRSQLTYTQVKFLYRLLNKYNVRSKHELRNLGITFPIDKLVFCMVLVNNIPFLNKLLRLL